MFFRIFAIILIALVAIFGITFVLSNVETVKVDYYFGIWDVPLALLLAVIFLAGLILGAIVNLVFLLKLKVENRSLKKKVKAFEEEIEHLKLASSSLSYKEPNA